MVSGQLRLAADLRSSSATDPPYLLARPPCSRSGEDSPTRSSGATPLRSGETFRAATEGLPAAGSSNASVLEQLQQTAQLLSAAAAAAADEGQAGEEAVVAEEESAQAVDAADGTAKAAAEAASQAALEAAAAAVEAAAQAAAAAAAEAAEAAAEVAEEPAADVSAAAAVALVAEAAAEVAAEAAEEAGEEAAAVADASADDAPAEEQLEEDSEAQQPEAALGHVAASEGDAAGDADSLQAGGADAASVQPAMVLAEDTGSPACAAPLAAAEPPVQLRPSPFDGELFCGAAASALAAPQSPQQQPAAAQRDASPPLPEAWTTAAAAAASPQAPVCAASPARSPAAGDFRSPPSAARLLQLPGSAAQSPTAVRPGAATLAAAARQAASPGPVGGTVRLSQMEPWSPATAQAAAAEAAAAVAAAAAACAAQRSPVVTAAIEAEQAALDSSPQPPAAEGLPAEAGQLASGGARCDAVRVLKPPEGLASDEEPEVRAGHRGQRSVRYSSILRCSMCVDQAA